MKLPGLLPSPPSSSLTRQQQAATTGYTSVKFQPSRRQLFPLLSWAAIFTQISRKNKFIENNAVSCGNHRFTDHTPVFRALSLPNLSRDHTIVNCHVTLFIDMQLLIHCAALCVVNGRARESSTRYHTLHSLTHLMFSLRGRVRVSRLKITLGKTSQTLSP